ncbi:hypothetical protein EJ04DRAFT_528748 [Polyplosphaeria fusca]|uniref:Thioredoxin domain-containing protein n=1 Tax=Polyplosphaeria fusca TaxID=682080 RepID=A0A9P4UXL6_9PLEO|nr:hypothetical protein EJ04DRAFT_528748 [Polyplosphaeria fusca]
MIIRPSISISRSLTLQIPAARRTFLDQLSHTQKFYANVRTPEELHTLTLLSAAEDKPLITLWTAKWCSTCQAVAPLVRGLIEERVGINHGGLGYVEVEMDAATIGDLPITFRITSMPTLLAFSRQEAQLETKITRPEQLKDKEFLRNWLISEAKRGGRAGGAGGKSFGGLFG